MTRYASLVLITLLGENNTTPVTSWQRGVRGHNILDFRVWQIFLNNNLVVAFCRFSMWVFGIILYEVVHQAAAKNIWVIQTIGIPIDKLFLTGPVQSFNMPFGLEDAKRNSNDVMGNDLDGASKRASTAFMSGTHESSQSAVNSWKDNKSSVSYHRIIIGMVVKRCI